jgi:hypothetical protein
MERARLEAVVREAVNMLYARDAALFANDNSEWALAHRLAVYLEQLCPGWNVDCEFNRQGKEADPKAQEDGTRIRPDVAVHHRGRVEKAHNLLAIELKKTRSAGDHAKLAECSSAPAGERRFQYQYALAISLLPLQMTWFENGRIVS